MKLAEPPFWESALLESPWMLIAVLLITAVALFWHGLQRADKKARRAAAIAVVIAGLIWLTSFLVTTPRETLVRQTREVVHATAPFSQAKFTKLLDEHAGVISSEGAIWMQGRDAIGMRGFEGPTSSVEASLIFGEGRTIL